MYLDRPLKDFITDTSSGVPTPGGGSVAALTGSLGSSLLSMVGNFTAGREEFKLVQKDVHTILVQLGTLTSKLCELIQQDILVYEHFSKVSSRPRNTPEEKKTRNELMQEALKKAAEVPMKTAECCFELLKLASRLGEIGNPRLISDVGVGALLAQAALESAVLNVEINLSYIKNHDYIKEKRESLVFFSKEGKKLATEIVEKVREKVVR